VTSKPPGSAADLDILVAAVEDLATAVGAHDRRLRKVERSAVRRVATPARRPVRRRGRAVAGARRRMAQPDPETAAAELIGWVDWLRGHYQLADRLPDSWRSEPAIVAELSALRHAWLGSPPTAIWSLRSSGSTGTTRSPVSLAASARTGCTALESDAVSILTC